MYSKEWAMRSFEITFPNINNEFHSKPITSLIIMPDKTTPDTGAMLFTHGWGSNRFQLREEMQYAAEMWDLVCISTEYRQSGFDFDPITGEGSYIPYDASFYQLFDVLNSLRFVLTIMPQINKKRLFHYGVSQGGNLALLSAIYAPKTFALIYAVAPITYFETVYQLWTGRNLQDHEISARSPLEHTDLIAAPIFLAHGLADDVVSPEHTKRLEEKLKAEGKEITAIYYNEADHLLEPNPGRFNAFKNILEEPARRLTNPNEDDFTAQRVIKIPCRSKSLIVDWSKPTDSIELFRWEESS